MNKDDKSMNKPTNRILPPKLQRIMQKDTVLLDGAMGTMLMADGLQFGESTELYALARPELLRSIHRAYIEAGADIIYACTFGANGHRLAAENAAPADVITRAIRIARESAAEADRDIAVALDIGPIGELIEPLGPLKAVDAYEYFRKMVIAGEQAGADLIVFETMYDMQELQTAIQAAVANTTLPIFCTMTFGDDLRTFCGADIPSLAQLSDIPRIAAIGVNCSPGPEGSIPIIRELKKHTDLPLIVKANAGLPNPITNTYDTTPQQFAAQMLPFADLGVKMLGGCCGTTPAHIAALHSTLTTIK